MAKLVLKFQNSVQKEVPLHDGVVSIGRLPDNTLQIDNPGVSSRHCRVVFEAGQYFVEDSGSTNGTFVNNQRVSRAQLIDGDDVSIGSYTIAFLGAVDTITALNTSAKTRQMWGTGGPNSGPEAWHVLAQPGR